MRQMNMLKLRMVKLFDQICAFVIRKMALSAEHALLVDHRSTRGVDHRNLMIRLDIEIITLLQLINDQCSGKTQIRAYSDLDRANFDRKPHGIHRIVLNSEWMDLDIAKFKGLACCKNLKLRANP